MTESNDEGFDFEAAENDISKEQGIPEGFTQVVLTEDMLRKRFVWDVAPCSIAEQTARILGLEASSEDVVEMEHTESHARLQQVVNMYGPFFEHFALYATQAVRGALQVQHGEELVAHPAFTEQALGPIVYQTGLAILSEMIDVGMVHLPHVQMVPMSQLMEMSEGTEDTNEDETDG